MQFFKIRCEMVKNGAGSAKPPDGSERRERAYAISARSQEFNGNKIGEDNYCFVSDIYVDGATLGMIVTRSVNLVGFAEEYAKAVGLEAESFIPEEVTLGTLQNLIGRASRMDYLEDEDEILEKYSLNKLNRWNGLQFGENLTSPTVGREELFKKAEGYYMTETLIPELERIYRGGGEYSYGHPVHYIIEMDDRDTRREVCKLLLCALRANFRLCNSRYTFLDFCPGESYSHMLYEKLYEVSEGGAVIVRYKAGDDSEDCTVSGERETVENICEMAKKYRNKVLTVICFPRECKAVKAMFYDNLGSMSFVELRDDHLSYDRARTFLSDMAKKYRIHGDKKLFAGIKEGNLYLANELGAMFDEWYNGKLKTAVFPQYKEVFTVRNTAVKAEPRGTAFEELDEMIGLSEAKAVIRKAVNYYKMQKLYTEHGVKRDNPAMHMVFTGNPGTAKTTVARLFARIMRENGLLSRGQMVEVGRGDLVGKYVGWTAQTVQEKFKEAEGGVLFIDEAYSLVDDRDGSYGDEAINTIVQEMENRRSGVVVIFAGYPDKMERFLKKNPGLRSRVAFHVPFADYDSTELCQIAQMLGKRYGMCFESSAYDKLVRVFDSARESADFGNGRYVRNLFEQARMNQATRLFEKDCDTLTAADITTITADDITPIETSHGSSRSIGFC